MTTILASQLSKVGDIVRGTLLVDKLEQIPHLLQSVIEQVQAQGGKFYIKNFWDDPKPLSLGYVGVHIKIRMPIPQDNTTGEIEYYQKRKYIRLEIQFHVRTIVNETEECAKEIAHRLYKAPRKTGKEKISPEIISSSQLVYLTSMTKLLSSDLEIKRVHDTLNLVKAATKADKKMHVILETAMLLHDKRLGQGTWNEELQVIEPIDSAAVAEAWMKTANKINKMLHLPSVTMDEREDWTNTATSIDEIYADAEKIVPLFRSICQRAADSQPGCSVNFGPRGSHIVKDKNSLKTKMEAKQEEALAQFITQLLNKIGRSWSQVCGSDCIAFERFSELRNLNFSDCHQITDSDLIFLRNLPALESLNLSGCNQITDEGLTHLENLKRLDSLNLSGCHITDKGLGHLWRLTNLKRINISGCDEITDSGLARAGLQNLKSSQETQSNSKSSEPTKDAYLAILLPLIEHPSVKQDLSILEILEQEAQVLLDQEMNNLKTKQHKSYELVKKLLIGEKISQLIAKNLRALHRQDEMKQTPVTQKSTSPEKQPKTPPILNAHYKRLEASDLRIVPALEAGVNREWITPEEQLRRLCLSSLEKDLADSVTNWYTALTRLAQVFPSVLPKKIPPLPVNIIQILNSRCPICTNINLDGTYYKIKDTHVLALIPREFMSINELNENILKPYEKSYYPNTENRLQLRIRVHKSDIKLDGEFEQTHWVLLTKYILHGTNGFEGRYRPAHSVHDLMEKTNIYYQLPTLKQSIAVHIIYKVATGENLYIGKNHYDNADYSILISVKERGDGVTPLAIGCSNDGITIDRGTTHTQPTVGTAALWNLSDETSAYTADFEGLRLERMFT